MPSLQIRDLPDDVYEALAYRAERSGRSLAQQALHELRKLTEVSSWDRRRAVIERIRRRTPPEGVENWIPPEDLIRRDRER